MTIVQLTELFHCSFLDFSLYVKNNVRLCLGISCITVKYTFNLNWYLMKILFGNICIILISWKVTNEHKTSPTLNSSRIPSKILLCSFLKISSGLSTSLSLPLRDSFSCHLITSCPLIFILLPVVLQRISDPFQNDISSSVIVFLGASHSLSS